MEKPLRRVLSQETSNKTVECLICGTVLVYLTSRIGGAISHWEVRRADLQTIEMEQVSLPPGCAEAIALCEASGTATAWDQTTEEVTVMNSLGADDLDETEGESLDDELENEISEALGNMGDEESDDELTKETTAILIADAAAEYEMELNADDEPHRRTHN